MALYNAYYKTFPTCSYRNKESIQSYAYVLVNSSNNKNEEQSNKLDLVQAACFTGKSHL
jgi:hypothetical protein